MKVRDVGGEQTITELITDATATATQADPALVAG
jgi:hypothetical protein